MKDKKELLDKIYTYLDNNRIDFEGLCNYIDAFKDELKIDDLINIFNNYKQNAKTRNI